MKKLKSQFAATARIKYLRISPFKLRRVADLIRGKSADESFFLLKALPHKGSKILLDALGSAVANAKSKSSIESSSLTVGAVWVDASTIIKRHRPRARGRMFAIQKRTSHVFIGLSENEGEN